MRRLLALLLCGVVAIGCHSNPTTSSSEAEQYINQLDGATDPKVIGDLSQKLYACGPQALDAIGDALNNVDYRSKPQLIAVASAMPDPKAVQIVDRQLRSRVQPARAMACYGLALHPHSSLVDALGVLKRDSDLDHEWGTYAIALSDYPQRKAFLTPGLKDKDEYVRASAVRGFQTLPGADSVALVTPLLKDPSQTVAAEAFITLAHIDPQNPDVQKMLAKVGDQAVSLKTQDKEGLVRVLGATDSPQAEPYLSKLLGDPDPRIRILAAKLYAKMGKASKPDRLMRSFTTDPDANVRAEVGQTLGKLEIDGIGKTLLKLCWDKDPIVAQIAVDTLVALHRPDCTGPLVYLTKKSPKILNQRKAAIGLSNMAIGGKPWPQVNEIINMASSNSVDERKQSAEFLGMMNGPRFFIKLQEMELDPNPGVRVAAMAAMKRQIGMTQTAPKVTAHPPPSWLEPLN